MLGNVAELCWDAYRIYTGDEMIDPVGPVSELADRQYENYGFAVRGADPCDVSDCPLYYRPACRAQPAHNCIGLRIVLAPEGKPDLKNQQEGYKRAVGGK